MGKNNERMVPEDNERMVPEDIGSLIPGLLGLGAQIGTAIPGLRKPQRTNAAEGAVTASTTGAARAAAAAGGAGFGATRGLVAREAGRQAQQVMLSAAPSIIQAANQDEIRYQRDMQDRNQRLAGFGQQLAAGMSTLGAGIGTMVGGEEAPADQGYAPTGYPGAEPAAAPAPAMQQGVIAAPPATAGMVTQAPGVQQAAPAPVEPTPTPSPQTAPAQSAEPTPVQPVSSLGVPDLTPLGTQARLAENAQYLSKIGLAPELSLQLEEYVRNPFVNPLALANPYTT